MSDKKYTKDHEWVTLKNDIATVGISDHAQESLGDIVFIELPTIGKIVNVKEEICVVESVKAASDVYSPISGEIIEVNEVLLDNPEIINESPYHEGWFYKLQPSDSEEIDELLSPEQYGDICEE